MGGLRGQASLVRMVSRPDILIDEVLKGLEGRSEAWNRGI